MVMIPQIWEDALKEVAIHNLLIGQLFAEDDRRWEEEHERRMATDPEYAREHEAFERQWLEDNERYEEEYT